MAIPGELYQSHIDYVIEVVTSVAKMPPPAWISNGPEPQALRHFTAQFEQSRSGAFWIDVHRAEGRRIRKVQLKGLMSMPIRHHALGSSHSN